ANKDIVSQLAVSAVRGALVQAWAHCNDPSIEIDYKDVSGKAVVEKVSSTESHQKGKLVLIPLSPDVRAGEKVTSGALE
ncbi:unnamed protein product, partial [Prorocentrum cordatum]